MDVLEAIKSRRSIRKYKKDDVPRDLVLRILEAGRWAPSAGNSQPWEFIVLRDKKIKKRVADATTYGGFLDQAPVGIAIVIDPDASTHPVEDGAAATQNMLLAVHALGLGACWIGSYGSVFEERVKKILGVPKEKRLLSLISMGFPDESPSGTRKELAQLVYRNSYGRKLK